MKSISFLLLFFLAITSFIFAQQLPDEEKKQKAFDINNIDNTVKPVDDFYQFVNGGWLKNNPVPGENSSWGSFDVLFEENNLAIKSIIEDITSGRIEPTENFKKLSILFNSGMDSVKIEADNYYPIKPYLARIAAIDNFDDFIKELAFSHLHLSSPLFSYGSEQDQKNSNNVIIGLSQGGLGLPERDYYTNTDDETIEIQSKYIQHIKNMFILIGKKEKDAELIASSVYNIEKSLADSSFTGVELRDVPANYNKMSVTELEKISPNFKWRAFFIQTGVKNLDEINVSQLKFFKNISDLAKTVSIEDWKNYLTWNLLKSSSPYLSEAFVNERFAFYGNYLYGAKVLQPRWKRVLSVIDSQIGEILGELYVKKYFPAEAKQKAQIIVKNLLSAMGKRIKQTKWMTDETKIRALKKLDSFNYKIGYPDKWRNYDNLQFSNNSFYDNVVAANYFNSMEDLRKIGKQVDRSEWGLNPQTVNAYYHPVLNEVVFPAAILQPPFFDYTADDAINYGSIGAVIGHEITHGFDDQGRQYDFDGNMRDWWNETDSKQFGLLTAKLVEQFNNFVVIDTLTVKGDLTLGENIADLGGLTVAYEAFRKSNQFNENKLIDGFTPQQRFFLGWAQMWRTNMTDEYTKMLLKVDVHSPAKSRVNGPLSNLPEFYDAFKVKDGDKMKQPDDKIIVIW